jgi:hypothetical protein
MFKHGFKPGSAVPQSGAYWVHHYQHRISHLVHFSAGERFPECVKCGQRVRFELAPDHQDAEHISFDLDLQSKTASADDASADYRM